MTLPLCQQIAERVPDAATMYSRLVLVVGPAGSGKTEALLALNAQRGWPRVNLNLELSTRLQDLTVRQRSAQVAGLLGDILRETIADVVMLDNMELLFSTELQLDPLRLLQTVSRNRTLIAAWAGEFDGRYLTYAEPGHAESRRYATPDAAIVSASGSAELRGEPSHSGLAGTKENS